MKFLILLMIIPIQLLANDYPSHWWKPVPKQLKHSWEITPDQAKPGEVILSKRNELGILSNFAHTPFEFEGIHYESVEGAWQSLKYPEGPKDIRAKAPFTKWPFTRKQVQNMIGFEAMKAGKIANRNMLFMGINWVSFKGLKMKIKTPQKAAHYKLIKKMIIEKIKQNPKVKEILLSTGNLILKPDHKIRKSAPPAWHYNEIYMEIRKTLQK